MTFKDIASVSGKSGLYKVLKATRTGMVLESLDEKKSKLVANANSRVSVLKDISIFTTDKEGSVPLEVVLRKIQKEFNDDPGVDINSSTDELKAFMKHIVPEYDTQRVYASDMKKLVAWYGLILKYVPEVLNDELDENEGNKEIVKENNE